VGRIEKTLLLNKCVFILETNFESLFDTKCSKWQINYDGSRWKTFDPGRVRTFFLLPGSVTSRPEKFPLKIPKFLTFLPLGQKNLIGLGQKNNRIKGAA